MNACACLVSFLASRAGRCGGIIFAFFIAVKRILAHREAELKRYLQDAELGVEMGEFDHEQERLGNFDEEWSGQHQVRRTSVLLLATETH